MAGRINTAFFSVGTAVARLPSVGSTNMFTINAYNDDGESALALAIARDDRATATRLLNAGATATREDERNCLSTDMRALVKGARSRKRARHGDGAGDV